MYKVIKTEIATMVSKLYGIDIPKKVFIIHTITNGALINASINALA